MGGIKRNSQRSSLPVGATFGFVLSKHESRLTCILAIVVSIASTTTTCAAEYPDRPIKFIVPAAPGTTGDIIARVVGTELSQQLAKQIIVDNRPGAGGIIAMEMIARSAPDGYTIGYGTASLAILRSMYAKLPFDPDKDFHMLVQMVSGRHVLTVTPSLPVKSVQELIDYAKSNRGKLSYGSPGNGSTQQLSAELFKLMTNTEIFHVPYKSTQQVIADMIGGQVPMVFDNLASIMPHVRAGRVRALGVSSPTRLPSLPDMPTIAETIPGFEVSTWSGVIMPAGVPKPISARLNTEINKALASTPVKEKLTAFGYELVGGSPEQFNAFFRKENVKWSDVVKRSGARID